LKLGKIKEQKAFEYEVDWVNYFESILRNEIRQEIDNPNKIKAIIVESNQSLEDFLKRNSNIKKLASKEEFFHNLRINYKDKDFYFYLNNSDKRFWIIHNIERQIEVQNIIQRIFTESYLQDKIYLTHKTLEEHQNRSNAESFGFTINFEQLFSSYNDKKVFIDELGDFDDIAFTLQLWPKKKKTIKFFLEKFKKIRCPINFKSLNFVFEDENREILIKEDLFYDGTATIHRGRNLRIHLNFIKNIRDDYREKIERIEENRTDWEMFKSNLFVFKLDKKINLVNFVEILNRRIIDGISNPFKINAFHMYKRDNWHMYNCIDLHTGGQFYMQISPSELIINLNKDSCGNIILRFLTNLQRYFSVSVKLEINNEIWDI